MKQQTLLPLEANKQKVFKKAFQYEFYPNEEQKVLLAKTFGCVRFVYNKNLDLTKTYYDNYVKANEMYKVGLIQTQPIRPIVTDYTLSANIAQIKANPDLSWLYEVSSVALQQTAIDLNTAFSRFFKHQSKFPKFKNKRDKQSFRLVGKVFKVDMETGTVFLPKSKVGIKLSYGRKLPCEPSRVTISKLPCGKYIATFLCEIIKGKTKNQG
jgi:putative transposase